MLFIKSRSPQKKLFKLYKVVGLGKDPGEITDKELPFPFTVVSRSNAEMVLRCLGLLARDANVKIAIQGDGRKFKGTVDEILDIYRLAKGEPVRLAEFKKYANFDDFKKKVDDLELSKYSVHLSLLGKLEDSLPQAMQQFESSVLHKKHNPKTADVILCTAHQAKGLEYDNVEVLDDFTELGVDEQQPEQSDEDDMQTFVSAATMSDKREVEFKLPGWGDELNLWYVSVTRPKKRLRLPKKWWALQQSIKATFEAIKTEGKKIEPIYKAKAKLFEEMQAFVGNVPIDIGFPPDFDKKEGEGGSGEVKQEVKKEVKTEIKEEEEELDSDIEIISATIPAFKSVPGVITIEDSSELDPIEVKQETKPVKTFSRFESSTTIADSDSESEWFESARDKNKKLKWIKTTQKRQRQDSSDGSVICID